MLVKLGRGIFVFEAAGKTQSHRLCNSRLCHHVPQKTARIIMFKLIRELSFPVSLLLWRSLVNGQWQRRHKEMSRCISCKFLWPQYEFFYHEIIKPHFCLIKHFHRTMHAQQLEKTYFPSQPPSDIYIYNVQDWHAAASLTLNPDLP